MNAPLTPYGLKQSAMAIEALLDNDDWEDLTKKNFTVPVLNKILDTVDLFLKSYRIEPAKSALFEAIEEAYDGIKPHPDTGVQRFWTIAVEGLPIGPEQVSTLAALLMKYRSRAAKDYKFIGFYDAGKEIVGHIAPTGRIYFDRCPEWCHRVATTIEGIGIDTKA